MKHVLSISGGIGSYMTLKRMIASGISKEEIDCIFCDTLNENGDLYRFLNDIEENTGIQITRLCTGETPYTLAYKDKFLYNSRIANCSKKLKSKPFREYMKDHYTADTAVLYFGIDFTESHRCAAIQKNYAPYQCRFPLCEQPYIYKNEMLEELKKDNIKVPYMYEIGFSHNNCNGFCFKAGIGHYKNLLEKDRNKYLEAENAEQEIIRHIGKPVAILKRKGKPITLRELRLIIETQPKQISMDECNDWGACGCFVDD